MRFCFANAANPSPVTCALVTHAGSKLAIRIAVLHSRVASLAKGRQHSYNTLQRVGTVVLSTLAVNEAPTVRIVTSSQNNGSPRNEMEVATKVIVYNVREYTFFVKRYY